MGKYTKIFPENATENQKWLLLFEALNEINEKQDEILDRLPPKEIVNNIEPDRHPFKTYLRKKGIYI